MLKGRMAQVSRALRRAFLKACPRGLRDRLLQTHPNLRKAAPEGQRFVFTEYCGDISVNVDTRYKVERIMWSGLYEPALIRFLQSQNIAGWHCFDVGANVGAISLVLAKLVGETGSVTSFEPGPPNLVRLRANIALNPKLASRVEVVEAGVGSRPGELWWEEEAGNPGNALLSDHGTHRIVVLTIDDFVRNRNVQRLDFMKIDVEGMELEVMIGARQTLQAFHPILYFETLPRYVSAGASKQDMRSFLEDCGYEIFRIESDGRLSTVRGTHFAGYTVALARKS